MDGLLDAAETVEKLLSCAKRSVMQFLDATQHQKTHAKLRMERLCVVAHDVEPAAFRRALRSKCANEYIPTRLHRARDLTNVSAALIHCGKEVKYSAVMPHIVCITLQFE